MSVTSEITRLQNAKADLKTAIEGKGVTVPSSTKLDGYADLVDSIQQGGGDGVYKYVSLSGKGTTEDNPFIIQLDDVPTFVEVRERNMRFEYFCFERVSNGKRSAILSANDESLYFFRGSAQASMDNMRQVSSMAVVSFS